jgi:hypothetical protein
MNKSFNYKENSDDEDHPIEKPYHVSPEEKSTASLDEGRAEIAKFWLAYSLPDFCFANEGSNFFDCPDDFPQKSGLNCF